MTLELIKDAVGAGARQYEAAKLLGLSGRTLQRWREVGGGEDCRCGPHTVPGNKLADQERENVLQVVNSPEFRDLPPTQIVPRLADRGEYIASESTMYRILREEEQLAHREKSRPATKRHKPEALVASGPNAVWSWDITYLKTPVQGVFFYLYMVLDVWSRKVIAWEVHNEESAEHSSALLARAYQAEDVAPGSLVVHMDNGSPMKGATLLATLERLGVATSFSRPSVSNDNPYSESLFRTMKYRPAYPSGPFESIEAAWDWVATFVSWYNTEHQHSSIRFVTPDDRHSGRDLEILERRKATYERARARNPARWSGNTRNWNQIKDVALNPEPTQLGQTG
jgi:transposase InsO family protein